MARVVEVFGAVHPHHAYCFTNRRANRVKVLSARRTRAVAVDAPAAPGRFAWQR